MFQSIKNRNVFYSLLAVLLLCKLFYWFCIYPNPDEAYYWHWGQYPALSYHDHPTLQATFQGVFYTLFGKSLFVLRLPAFICSLLCGYVIFLITKKLQFTNTTLYVILFFSSPLFFLFTSFAWNDYVLITNCFLAGYFMLNCLHNLWIDNKVKTKDIFLTALFSGLAIISKYNAIFLVIAIFTILLSHKKFRKFFYDYRLYIAILIMLVVSSPILIWNIQNKYGSFEFNLQQRTLNPLVELQFFKGNYLGFILGSLVMLSPFLWWGIIKSWKKFSTNDNSYLLIYQKFAKHIFIVSSSIFLFLSLFSNVLYYWNIVAYLFIIPLAGNVLIEKKKVIGHLIFSVILIFGAVFHFGIVPLTAVFGGEDQDSTYHYGWKEVKKEVQKLQKEYPDAILLTSSYRKASLLAYALDNKEVYAISPRFDQFDYWIKNASLIKNRNAIILTDDRKPVNKELKKIINTILSPDTLKIKRFKYPVKEYYIYTGKLK